MPESTCQTEANRAGAIYFVRSLVFCNVTAKILATSDYIRRIGPVVEIGLPVGSTLNCCESYK